MRRGGLAALVGAVALAAGAGCGGSAGDDDAGPRQALQRYFGAVAAGRAGTACAQLTEASRERLAEFAEPLHARGTGCEATMGVVLRSPYGKRLARLAHPSIVRLERRGDRATAVVDGVDAPLELRRSDGAWRIEFTPSVEADRLPGGPREEEGEDEGEGEGR